MDVNLIRSVAFGVAMICIAICHFRKTDQTNWLVWFCISFYVFSMADLAQNLGCHTVVFKLTTEPKLFSL